VAALSTSFALVLALGAFLLTAVPDSMGTISSRNSTRTPLSARYDSGDARRDLHDKFSRLAMYVPWSKPYTSLPSGQYGIYSFSAFTEHSLAGNV